MQKRIYKVLTAIPKRDGSGSWFMRVGSAYTNKDDSINLYLDAIPVNQGKGVTLQIRELDEADLRQRDGQRDGQRAASARSEGGGSLASLDSIVASQGSQLPF